MTGPSLAKVSRVPDAVVLRLARYRALDRLGRTLGVAFSNVVRPGALKDLLSGTWLGHPTHPMLTDVPIGAWTSSFVLDSLGPGSERASDALIGLGVLAALPTAVTGLSDLADVVEQEDRSIGVAHALTNTGAVCLYALSFVQRRRGRRGAGKALSLAGAAVATAGAYLGGHLVFRRVIGPNQALLQPPMDEWTTALAEEDLPEGKPRRVHLGGADILLYREGARVYALANRCSHRGGPLHKGEVGSGRVTCPWHLSTFRLADGSIIRGPATAPQPAYETRTLDGQIQVRARRP